jgi:hypothetical protein
MTKRLLADLLSIVCLNCLDVAPISFHLFSKLIKSQGLNSEAIRGPWDQVSDQTSMSLSFVDLSELLDACLLVANSIFKDVKDLLLI